MDTKLSIFSEFLKNAKKVDELPDHIKEAFNQFKYEEIHHSLTPDFLLIGQDEWEDKVYMDKRTKEIFIENNFKFN